MSKLSVLAMLLVSTLPPAVSALRAADIPRTVDYEGLVVDAAGEPLEGNHSATFGYFDMQGTALYEERFDSIVVTGGRFDVRLGTGSSSDDGSFDSLYAVFAANPEIELEVTLGKTIYGPRVGLLPSGHSLKSRLVAAGLRAANDDEAHWRGYESRSGATAVQATQLAPVIAPQTNESAQEKEVWRRPYLFPVVGPMLSRQARDLPVDTERGGPPEPARELNPPRHEQLFDEEGNRFGTIAPKVNDVPAAEIAGGVASAPLLLEFEGIDAWLFLPPDTDGAVGPNHYVQMVNVETAIYDKSGNLLVGPFFNNELWDGFGGPCEILNNGDPIALYDQQADRFVLSQFAVNLGVESICVAISQTPDPTGAYYLYELQYPSFPDYYKLGVWPNGSQSAYFISTNSGYPGGYTAAAVNRDRMLAGLPTNGQYFFGFPNLLMPADSDGPTPPPEDSPGLLYTFRDEGEPYFGIPTPDADSIDVYEFDIDFLIPSNTTLELVQEITPAQGLDEFNWTVCGFFNANCVPQPDTEVGIDSQSWWPMQRLVYRNFGTHETLLGSWTVEVEEDSDRAAPRWFELRRDLGPLWQIEQQGTHAPDRIHRWMPSIAMDGQGNIALGYSRSDKFNHPSIYYATRSPSDPPGSLRDEALLWEGRGSQSSPSYRWGDYATMEIDPSDDCTFWYQNEYYLLNSGSAWKTRIGAFRVPECSSTIFDDGFESGDFSAWSTVEGEI
jgi:hypothetical protein